VWLDAFLASEHKATALREDNAMRSVPDAPRPIVNGQHHGLLDET
jgi:hypothetical protein